MTLTAGFFGYRFMGKAHANALGCLPMFFPDAPDIERSVLVGRTRDVVEAAANLLGFDRVEIEWEAVLDDIDDDGFGETRRLRGQCFQNWQADPEEE